MRRLPRSPHRTSQKCEPSFGAIPSATDRQKKQQEAAEAEEKRDEVLAQIMQKAALARLNELDFDEPAKVRARHALPAPRIALMLAVCSSRRRRKS